MSFREPIPLINSQVNDKLVSLLSFTRSTGYFGARYLEKLKIYTNNQNDQLNDTNSLNIGRFLRFEQYELRDTLNIPDDPVELTEYDIQVIHLGLKAPFKFLEKAKYHHGDHTYYMDSSKFMQHYISELQRFSHLMELYYYPKYIFASKENENSFNKAISHSNGYVVYLIHKYCPIVKKLDKVLLETLFRKLFDISINGRNGRYIIIEGLRNLIIRLKDGQYIFDGDLQIRSIFPSNIIQRKYIVDVQVKYMMENYNNEKRMKYIKGFLFATAIAANILIR